MESFSCPHRGAADRRGGWRGLRWVEGKRWRDGGPAGCPAALLWAGCYPALRRLHEAHPEIPGLQDAILSCLRRGLSLLGRSPPDVDTAELQQLSAVLLQVKCLVAA